MRESELILEDVSHDLHVVSSAALTFVCQETILMVDSRVRDREADRESCEEDSEDWMAILALRAGDRADHPDISSALA